MIQVRSEARQPEFIGGRLFKVTPDLRDRAEVVSFVGAYAPTETSDASREHVLGESIDRAG